MSWEEWGKDEWFKLKYSKTTEKQNVSLTRNVISTLLDDFITHTLLHFSMKKIQTLRFMPRTKYVWITVLSSILTPVWC